MPIVYMTRREQFSAAHRLHSPSMSDEENKQVYGKCNNATGHGHNYAIEVTVRGEVNPRTGMVMDLVDLKRAIESRVLSVLDHHNIDLDVPYFRDGGIVSTTENVAIFCWHELKLELADKLYDVKIWETDKNVFSYRGE